VTNNVIKPKENYITTLVFLNLYNLLFDVIYCNSFLKHNNTLIID